MTRILITRPRAQTDDFADKLREAGFEPILFPVIEIRPVEDQRELEEAIANIEKYSWVIFTSVNAVDVIARSREAVAKQSSMAGGLLRYFMARNDTPKIAAVGSKTADALRKHGIEPDFIPDEFRGEAILSGLGDVNGKWVLLPRAEIARKELPEAIRCAGGVAHEIAVYQTLPAEIDQAGLLALKNGVDVIAFTSPSTIENFVEIICQQNISLNNHPLIACIGTITEKAAREAGFENIIVAKEFTTDGLVSLLVASQLVE